MSWISDLPKVELHLHLEGAIPLDALFELVTKYDGTDTIPDEDTLREAFQYTDFPHFLKVWHWKNQFIREAEDFCFIAEAFAKELASQNIIYAEAFFSPTDFANTGMTVQDIASAIRAGLDKVESTKVNLISDLVRDNGSTVAGRVLKDVSEVREQGIIGIGIGGSEHRFPPADFQHVYDEARQLGFHTTAHAGEASGSDSVADAINILRSERIGHGTRAVEDEAIMQLILDQSIHVEACPNSNLKTGVTDQINQHPIREFFDRGISVSVNTDDPVMFNCTLEEELELLMTELNFTQNEIVQLMRNAAQGSFLEDKEKELIYQQLDDYTGLTANGAST